MKQEHVIRYYDLNTGYHAFVGKAQRPLVFDSHAAAEAYLNENPANSLPSHGDRFAMRYEVVKFWRLQRPGELANSEQAAPDPQGPAGAQAEPGPQPEEFAHASPALAKVLKSRKP
jgi:hypothetical protein